MLDKNCRILAVDDFSTMRRIMKNILRQLGYANVDEAENGVLALRALKEKKYDLVISDWNMPEMTGIDLLKGVRSDPELKATPFLMVTAEAEKAQVVEAIQAGVSSYILKPFTAKLLEEKLVAMFPELSEVPMSSYGAGGVVEKYVALQKELVLMVEYINETRRTLGALKGALPGASDILSGVSETMERATHDILGMVEKLIDADLAVQPALDQAQSACTRANDPQGLAAVEVVRAAADVRLAGLTEIMTALSFQDLTCQALNKIGTTMVEIEKRMVRLVDRETPGELVAKSEAPGFSGLSRLRESQSGEGRQGQVDDLLKGR